MGIQFLTATLEVNLAISLKIENAGTQQGNNFGEKLYYMHVEASTKMVSA